MDVGLAVPLAELPRRIEALYSLRRYWVLANRADLLAAQEVLGASTCAELLAGGSFKVVNPVYISKKWDK